FTGPSRLVYSYEGANASVFMDAGAVNNMLVGETLDASVMLTDATWVAMDDGYYYEIASTWASDARGVYEWDYRWDFSSDGETLEDTRSADRLGFLGDDGLGNYVFLFTYYDADNDTRKVTWYTTATDNGDGSFSFAVTGCFDTESGEDDLTCDDNFPHSFDLIGTK
ncbi:hypothetical protein KJ865_02265, partial [Myxococcota bacterium]|nr:hypothetical protein [Myxococcota bacterium]